MQKKTAPELLEQLYALVEIIHRETPLRVSVKMETRSYPPNIIYQVIDAVKKIQGADPLARSQSTKFADARRLCYAILRDMGYTLEYTGGIFGKNHATVIMSLRGHDTFLQIYPEYKKKYLQCHEELHSRKH